MGIIRTTYFKRVKRGVSIKKKYMKAWEAAQREVFKAYADEIATGYNSIVSNWSSKSKPSFVGRAEFQTRTGRWFVRVQIVGTEIQRARFEGLDEGAKRGQKVATPDVTDPSVMAAQLKGAGVQTRISAPRGVDLFGAAPQGVTAEAHAKWIAQQKAKYASYYRGGKQLTAVELSQARKRQMYPALRYVSKTGLGGRIGGSGEKRQPPTGWMHEYALGEIVGRAWTVGLEGLMTTGKNVAGARKIWPRISTWDNAVRRAYERGNKRTRASQG